MILKVKRLNADARLPAYGSDGAIGMDLVAALLPLPLTTIIEPGYHRLIPTGISVAIPSGFYGRIAPRSGLALKHGIDVLAGVIDSDYRGEIGVILINHSDKPFDIRHGDRIAQLILERAERLPVVEVDDLDDTSRGAQGFGSTGL